ncbi:MAG TPA: hypothetical protein ENJ53_04125, partial [Phaeodactylibacter sp.]|nr:hypothetical protein [Phaeodactylibacter sp.]
MTIFYKVRQSKFFVFFIFTLAISLLFVNCKSNTPNQRTTSANDILTAPISNLNVIKGTRIKVFLSAIDDHLENVNFTCLDCPPFIFLSKNKNGNATLTIDANEKADKNISIKIQTQNGENSTTTSLNISFTKHEGKIYYCQPNESEARGKGTKESPFSSLEKIMESSFVPEENALFLLLNGFHGAPTISKNNIIIAAATGNDPQL